MDQHYSGILVLARPADLDLCRAELERLDGIEVHFLYPDSGRIIAVQETATAEEQQDGLRRIQALPSVRSAALVEHRIDRSGEIDEIGPADPDREGARA